MIKVDQTGLVDNLVVREMREGGLRGGEEALQDERQVLYIPLSGSDRG